MFADELIALHDTCPDADITYIANLEQRGLPKTRLDAELILEEMKRRGMKTNVSGRWTSMGQMAIISEKTDAIAPAFALLCGVPHAIPPRIHKGYRVLLHHEWPPAGRPPPCARPRARDGGDRPAPKDARGQKYR